jgi:hypothetical protein
MSTLVAICHRCEHGNADKKCQGSCPCRADADRRDILVHIANASHSRPTCPLNKHNNIDPGAPMPAPDISKPIEPIPFASWGPTALALYCFSRPQDFGLGDTCKRILTMNCESGICNRAMIAAARLAVLAHLKSEYPEVDIDAQIEAWVKGENQCGNCEFRRIEQNQKYKLR